MGSAAVAVAVGIKNLRCAMARVPSGKRSTIYDIASMTNSAPATVSLVLNGKWAQYRIREETAERILEAARKVGYSVNLNARGLRLSRSGLAGMVLPHYRNRFFADMAETFEQKARARGFCPIVVSTHRDPELEAQFTSTLLAQQVEFLFLTGVRVPNPLNALCAERRIPCVNLDLPGQGAPSVVSGNQEGSARLTDRLIERIRAAGLGLDGFLFLGGRQDDYATDARVAGFLEALERHGVRPPPEAIVRCGLTPAGARDALANYHAEHGRLPIGLFIHSITACEGVAEFTSCLAPDELRSCSAGCFDWDPFAARMMLSVTMMRQDVKTMVEHAFEALSPERQETRAFTVVPPILIPETAVRR